VLVRHAVRHLVAADVARAVGAVVHSRRPPRRFFPQNPVYRGDATARGAYVVFFDQVRSPGWPR
jgi:hypothetical protein